MGTTVNRLLYLLLTLLLCSISFSVAADDSKSVTVYALSGEASYIAAGAASSQKQSLSKGQQLPLAGTITVGDNSRLGLRFSDGRLVRLRENSELELTPSTANEEESVNLLSGAVHIFNRVSKARYNVKTPEVSAAIRGTELAVTTENGETTLTVFDGEAQVQSGSNPLRIGKGESVAAAKGSQPVKLVLMQPVEQVQWALYFPVLFSSENHKKATDSQQQSLLRSYDHAYRGEYQEALRHIPAKEKTPEATLLKSSLYLLTGAPEKAEPLLQNLLTRSEFISAAASRLGLIHLISQDRAQAAAYLQQAQDGAVNSRPDENTFLLESLLLSQAGEIEKALSVIEKALKQFPTEPIFMARKSELLLGTGDTENALSVALKAYSLNSLHPMISTILGFSYLARREPELARASFENALSRGGELPEAHFGRALSLLAAGELSDGREELEKTVHLDTARSLYRSYLGKAFFEEEDEVAAEKEYALAIDRDPNDPTPYLYRAFNHLSRNNVIGALNDIEESITRNDARGVYRSRSLLDQDLAVRSTSLSEVFRQLGFRDVARIEAMKSLSRDYSNYSAHRLLGETLEGDFFADAKLSQRLISELLSPLSFNSFQSFNGFSSEPSANDYAALFDRPAHRTALNLQGTNVDDDYQGSVLQSGTEGDLGYLAAYSRRSYAASELEQQNARLALQYQPHADHRFIIEGEVESFDDDVTNDTFERKDLTLAAGSYHQLSNTTEVITRLEYFGRDVDTSNPKVTEAGTQTLILGSDPSVFSDLFPELLIELDQQVDEEIDNLRGSAQIIHQQDSGSLVSGIEYLYSDTLGEEKSVIVGDSYDVFKDIPARRDSNASYITNSYNLYSYLNQNLSQSLAFTLGFGLKSLELPSSDSLAPYVDGKREKVKLSPKFGFTFTPTDTLTVRGAYFQNLGTSSINDLGSIEPVLVGSFVQLLGDLPGAETETFGLGIDYKDPKRSYTGIEYAYRDIERTDREILNEFTTDAVSLTDSFSLIPFSLVEKEREHLIRAYHYQIFSQRLAGLAEYRAELKTEYNEELAILQNDNTNASDDIHRLKLGARYFSSSPWFFLTDLEWYQQDLKGSLDRDDGVEAFWILNAGVGYRIPRRKGQVRFQLVNLLDKEVSFFPSGRFSDPPSGIGFLTDISVNF